MYYIERFEAVGWVTVGAPLTDAQATCNVAQRVSKADTCTTRVYQLTGKPGYTKTHNVAMYSHGEIVYTNVLHTAHV